MMDATTGMMDAAMMPPPPPTDGQERSAEE